jgi:hypothetical protein
MNTRHFALLFIVLAVAGAGVAVAAPAVGDTYVYRVVNGYSNETRGQVTYRVDKVDASSVTLSVAPDHPSLGAPHTEILASDANWLRHPLINHDMPVEYDFAPAYPAYMAPLDSGKSWSARVSATNPASGRRTSVRVDGDVLGTERITTPAGAFDTIKVKRRVYAGDWETFTMETNIVETDWYAPALGRPVRTERNSGYMDPQKCGNPSSACTSVRGDWLVFELLKYNRK